MLGWAGTNLVASPPSTGNAIQKSRSFNLHPFPHWLSWELDLSTLADPGAAGQEGPEELKNPTAPTLHWAVGCTSPFPLGSSPWHYGLPPLGTPGYGTGQQATEEQQHRQRPGQSKCFAWRLGIFLPKGPQLGGASTGFGVQQVVHLDGGTSATEAFLPTDAADAEVWAALAAALGKVGPIA